MNGLLPHVIEHAVSGKSVSVTSQSFGVVALILLVVLLVEREALRVVRVQSGRLTALAVVSAPLLVALTLTIAARLALLIH